VGGPSTSGDKEPIRRNIKNTTEREEKRFHRDDEPRKRSSYIWRAASPSSATLRGGRRTRRRNRPFNAKFTNVVGGTQRVPLKLTKGLDITPKTSVTIAKKKNGRKGVQKDTACGLSPLPLKGEEEEPDLSLSG